MKEQKRNVISRSSLTKAVLASVIATGGLMTGCSDDVEGYTPEVSTTTAMFGNNPSEQAGRVTFYGTSRYRSANTRAVEDFPEIGEVPTIPAGTPAYNTPNDAQQDTQNDARTKGYELKGGNGQIELYGGKVYITGDVSCHNLNGTGGTIYVMPGAKLTLTCNVQNCTIIALGELETGNADITVGVSATILVKNNLVVHGRYAVEGTCVVKENLTVENMLQVSNGHLKAKCINVLGNGNEGVNMSGGGELAVRSYLTTPKLYLGDQAHVYLWPNAMAEVDEKTTMTSIDAGFVYYSSEGKSGKSLLKTGEFHVEGGAENPVAITTMFAHELKIDYTTFTNTNPSLTSEYLLVPAEGYYIPGDGCNPGHGNPGQISFDPVAVIDGPTHTHTHLSATCVQAANGKAYVSYHLNEAYEDNAEHVAVNNHQGCVEVYEVDDTHASITSWLINTDHDFNHLIVDNDKMYTTGDVKAGGRLGIITLDASGQFGQQSAEMTTVTLNGTSGNCIVRDGDNFRIATNLGFQSLDANTLGESAAFIATPGSGKHIAMSNGMIATLQLNERGVESSSATVNVYNSWGLLSASFPVSNVTPINGKNVIAIDGNSIYVCLGENGVEKYSLNGVLEASYNWIKEHPNTNGRPCANGLAVDGNHVYVAYGGVGLLVLDKNLNREARYYHKDETTNDAKYSANYVALVNGYIYIAYGRNGLEVVKMK